MTTPGFDAAGIRAAERVLARALEDPDTSRRASSYTEDAVFLFPGAPAVHGREELLRRPTVPLNDVVITPLETEGLGNLACVYGLFSCVVGRTAYSFGSTVVMRFLMVWRRESDGVWRIARESLSLDTPEG